MEDANFDSLTRFVAAGSSRRHILRLLAAGALGGALGPRGWRRPTTARAQTAPPVETSPENTTQGRCDELDKLTTRGVKGTAPEPYAGLSGATEPHFSVTWDDYTIKSDGKRNGKVCRKTTPVRMLITGNPRSFRLDWQPAEAADPAGCQAAVADWIARVTRHEQDHYRAAQEIAARFQQSEQPKVYKACGRNADAAGRSIKKQVAAERDRVAAAMADAWQTHLKEYHQQHGDTEPPPDCEKCCPENWCCPPTPKPCGEQCCKEDEQCCGGQCCPPGKQCCDGQCKESCGGTKIYCRCNRTCYDDAVACTSNCRAGLGCFTDICRPAQPGEC